METLYSRSTPVRRSVRYAIYGVVAVGVAAAGFGLWWLQRNMLSFDGPATVRQTSKPLTAAETQHDVPFALPDSARNVQYWIWNGGWMAFDDRVRFEAPVDDCVATAKRIVDKYNAAQIDHPDWKVPGIREMDPKSLDDLIARAGASLDLDPPANPTPWFCLESIKTGLVAGDIGSHTPLILIDTEHGVFYYRMTD